MSFPGSIHQGLQLAKQRWSMWNSFDLEDVEWRRLFGLYSVGLCLEAIKTMRNVGDARPEQRYAIYVNTVEKMYATRYR